MKRSHSLALAATLTASTGFAYVQQNVQSDTTSPVLSMELHEVTEAEETRIGIPDAPLLNGDNDCEIVKDYFRNTMHITRGNLVAVFVYVSACPATDLYPDEPEVALKIPHPNRYTITYDNRPFDDILESRAGDDDDDPETCNDDSDYDDDLLEYSIVGPLDERQEIADDCNKNCIDGDTCMADCSRLSYMLDSCYRACDEEGLSEDKADLCELECEQDLPEDIAELLDGNDDFDVNHVVSGQIQVENIQRKMDSFKRSHIYSGPELY